MNLSEIRSLLSAAQTSNEFRNVVREVETLRQSIHRDAGEHTLNPEQTQQWEALDELEPQAREGLRVAESTERREASRRQFGHQGFLPSPTTAPAGDSSALRSIALAQVEDAHRSGSLPDHAADEVSRLLDTGSVPEKSVAARWAALTGNPAYLGAFMRLAADPQRGHLMWTPQEADAYRAVQQFRSEMRAMVISDDPDGGYMVPLTLDPAILITGSGSISPLRRIARKVTVTTDSWHGVSSAGVTAEWKTEGTQVADASPTLEQPPIPVHLGDAFVPYSYEVGMDAVDFTNQLAKLLYDAADQLQATAYTTGSGENQPTGVITAVAADAGTVALITPTVAESLTAADLPKVQNALPPRFQPNAQWCANLSIINEMAAFETTNGALRFPEIANNRLLRKPLNECSTMDGAYDAAATANNYVLLYGDFNNFVIVDRIGTTMEFIPNLMGANGRPTAQRGALLWFRTGSDTVVPNSFRLLNIATTA